MVPKQTRRGLIAEENMPTRIDCITVCNPSSTKLTGAMYRSLGLETKATITPVEIRYALIRNALKLRSRKF